MCSTEIDKSNFELIGQSPYLWLSSAIHLKKAADTIGNELKKILSVYPRGRAPYEELVLFKSYMLLAGLSVENLIKGILIGRNPDIVNSNNLDLNLLTRSKGGHDLSALVKKSSLQLSPEELGLIERLTIFVVWAGKYPIHFKADQTNHPYFKTNDPEIIDKLFKQLVTVLKNENPT